MKLGYLFVLVLTLVAGACAPQATSNTNASAAVAPRPGGTLVYAAGETFTPSSVDMFRSTLAGDQLTGSQLYETLYRLKPTGGVEDWLAEKTVISSDGLTWTITLRSGVKFHDGTDFDAAAVKDNIERRQARDIFPLRSQLAPIKVGLVDSRTVQLLLARPMGPLRTILASPFMSMQSPTAMAKFPNPVDYARNAAGTAPYKIVSWGEQEITLTRFDQYWGPKAYLDGLAFRVIPDPAARLLALQAGDVQFIDAIGSESQLQGLRNEGRVSVLTVEPYQALWMVFNGGKGPAVDKRVRQAMINGINKDAIPAVYFGNGTSADSLVAPSIVGYTKEAPYPYDPQKAKQLLAEAGLQPGTPLVLVPGSGGNPTSQAAQLIKQDLDRLGFNVTIRALELNAWLAEVLKPAADSRWDITVYIAGASQTFDAEEPYRRFLYSASDAPKGNNWSHYKNPQFDALLDQQSTVSDVTERNRLLAQIHHILWNDVPVYPVAWTGRAFVASKAVRDADVRTGFVFLNRAWLAP